MHLASVPSFELSVQRVIPRPRHTDQLLLETMQWGLNMWLKERPSPGWLRAMGSKLNSGAENVFPLLSNYSVRV